MGMLFSRRQINGRLEKFCNLTSIVVEDHYRDYCIFLLRPLVKLKGYTLTDLTPSSAITALFRRFHFKTLDNSLHMLLPMTPWNSALRNSSVRAVCSKEKLETILKGEYKRIFTDHKDLDCYHVVMTNENSFCYLVYTKVTRTKIPYCHIQYVSDLDVFARCSEIFRSLVGALQKTHLILIDSRMAEYAGLPSCVPFPIKWTKLYMSETLLPHQIDNLYSENILLNLENVPSLGDILTRGMRPLSDLKRALFAGALD